MTDAPLCTACVYATLIYPDSAARFWQCGNPEYSAIDLVDGSKSHYGCAQARRYRDKCGPDAKGFLAHTPEFKRPVIPKWEQRRLQWKYFWTGSSVRLKATTRWSAKLERCKLGVFRVICFVRRTMPRKIIS